MGDVWSGAHGLISTVNGPPRGFPRQAHGGVCRAPDVAPGGGLQESRATGLPCTGACKLAPVFALVGSLGSGSG
jgi:hypothetical protein